MATVYAVASAKGGVGKTTTTAALATLLADAGADVVAVDADLGMANLAGALGVDVGETTLHDVLAGRAEPEAAVHEGPAGLRVLPGETDLDAYAAPDPAGIRDVTAAFDDADYVFLDGSAGLSHDSALPLGLADETLLVSTAERDALTDTEKTRQLTERLGGTVAGAAITRVDPDEPETGIVDELLDTPVLGRIPEDPAIAEALRAGEPLPLFAPHAAATGAYRSLATALTGEELSEPAAESDAAERDDREATDQPDREAASAATEGAEPVIGGDEAEAEDTGEAATEPEIGGDEAATDEEAAADEYGAVDETEAAAEAEQPDESEEPDETAGDEYGTVLEAEAEAAMAGSEPEAAEPADDEEEYGETHSGEAPIPDLGAAEREVTGEPPVEEAEPERTEPAAAEASEEEEAVESIPFAGKSEETADDAEASDEEEDGTDEDESAEDREKDGGFFGRLFGR